MRGKRKKTFQSLKNKYMVAELEIVFVRHSHSCANLKMGEKSHSILHKLSKSRIRNPNLSNLGLQMIEQAPAAVLQDPTLHKKQPKTLQGFLNKVDYVFCSEFLRA